MRGAARPTPAQRRGETLDRIIEIDMRIAPCERARELLADRVAGFCRFCLGHCWEKPWFVVNSDGALTRGRRARVGPNH
jgi:hypothetical protein